MQLSPERQPPKFREYKSPVVPEWVREYGVKVGLRDLSAGLIVSVMLIPQGMAYAYLAGMPPIYGLYASIVPLCAYAFLGSSRHLSVGTVAIDSLIMFFALSKVATPGTEDYIGHALMFSVMVGAVHLLLSIGRLGFLVNLLSRPVIIGFIAAAGAIIGGSQLTGILGLELPRSERIAALLYQVVLHIEETHLLSLLVGLAGVFILIAFRYWNRRFPAALVLVCVSVLITWGFDLEHRGVDVVGNIPTGLPHFAIPVLDIETGIDLLVPAVLLALIQFTNVVSLGKAYSVEYDYPIYPNRELFALSIANIAGAFFQSYPVSGSFSRTAINAESGAQTPIANIFTAFFVAVALLFLTPLLYYIPVPILAAIIIVAVSSLFKVGELRKLYKIKKVEGHLAVGTFLVTIVFGLQIGIAMGILASVTMIMHRISWPNVAVLGNLPGTRSYRDVTLHEDAMQVYGILVLRVDASFFYANADFLKDLILKRCDLESNEIHSVIIDASSVNDIDTTAVEALITIVKRLKSKSVTLYMTGTHGRVSGVLRRSSLYELIGGEHFFLSPYRAVEHIKHLRMNERYGNHMHSDGLRGVRFIEEYVSQES